MTDEAPQTENEAAGGQSLSTDVLGVNLGETMKQFDDSISLQKRGYGRVEVRKEGWMDGDVLTPYGIVTVYAQGDAENVPHTKLDFVWRGRLHIRNFNGKRYSARGIVTKAMEFATEIAAPNV